MDSSSLARLSFGGCQGSRSGEVAQESVLSQNWCSAGTGQQGEDQKHHERSLFARNSVGVGTTRIQLPAFSRAQNGRMHPTF